MSTHRGTTSGAAQSGFKTEARARVAAPSGTRDLAVVAAWLRAIAHPVRLRVLIDLRDGPRAAHVVSETLKVAQPELMRHLRALARLKIIDLRRHRAIDVASLSAPFVVLDAIDCILRDPRSWK